MKLYLSRVVSPTTEILFLLCGVRKTSATLFLSTFVITQKFQSSDKRLLRLGISRLSFHLNIQFGSMYHESRLERIDTIVFDVNFK